MDQTKLCGTQSLHFQRPAYILSAASVAGKKEAEGPLGKKFDMVDEQDNLFGAKTWEEAESNMQKEACILAIGKAGQNARLAAKLTSWKIDIKSESQAAELAAQAEAPQDSEPADDIDILSDLAMPAADEGAADTEGE